MKKIMVAELRTIVTGLCVMLVVFGCASPEVEQYETIYSDNEQQGEPGIAHVSKIFTEDLVGKTRITIEADSELTYTAFKLTDPLRLVLDLPHVGTTQVSETIFDNKFPLTRITPFQFMDGDTVNSRVEVALSRLVPYQVFSDGNRLFIDLEGPINIMESPMTASTSLPPGFEELTPLPQQSTLMTQSQPEKGASIFPMPESQTIQPAPTAEFQIGQAAMQPAPMSEMPPLPTSGFQIGDAAIQPAPMSEMPPLPTSGFQIGDAAMQPAPNSEMPSLRIEQPPRTVGGVSPLSGGLIAIIRDVQVSEVDGKTRIVIFSDRTPEFEIKTTQRGRLLSLDLKQSELPAGGEKTLKPDDMATTVKDVRAFQLRRSPDGRENIVRVRIDMLKASQHEVMTEPGKIILDVEHPAVFARTEFSDDEGIAETPLITGVESALLGEPEASQETEIASEPTIRAPKTGDEKEYKGQLISLHFQEAEVLDVLQVISEVSGLNLVVHPGVSGTVTIHLTNVPWDQALDIVLKMNNLSVAIDGNILRVADAGVFQQEIDQRVDQQRRQIEARQVQEALEPLVTKLITVNFAEPGRVVGIIDEYFQGRNNADTDRRGTITVDERTKTLIIQDTDANIKKIQEIVSTLDRRTPQVMIEARIVALNTLMRKELGINWTGSFYANPQHGNALDYRFPYSVEVPGFGVNLPGLSGQAIGTSGQIRLGSIDDVITIFAQIDAAEQEYKAKTLGQPKIFTQDNVGASVTATQTRQIAGTATVSPDGTITTTSRDVSAALTLSVTPRVSSDGYISMTVTVANGSFTDPTGGNVSQQNVNSEITIKDGETAVIGGVYQTSEFENFVGVPYLHKIPLIGRLFKSTLPNSQEQSELLVFLTPHVLDRRTLNQKKKVPMYRFHIDEERVRVSV